MSYKFSLKSFQKKQFRYFYLFLALSSEFNTYGNTLSMENSSKALELEQSFTNKKLFQFASYLNTKLDMFSPAEKFYSVQAIVSISSMFLTFILVNNINFMTLMFLSLSHVLTSMLKENCLLPYALSKNSKEVSINGKSVIAFNMFLSFLPLTIVNIVINHTNSHILRRDIDNEEKNKFLKQQIHFSTDYSNMLFYFLSFGISSIFDCVFLTMLKNSSNKMYFNKPIEISYSNFTKEFDFKNRNFLEEYSSIGFRTLKDNDINSGKLFLIRKNKNGQLYIVSAPSNNVMFDQGVFTEEIETLGLPFYKQIFTFSMLKKILLTCGSSVGFLYFVNALNQIFKDKTGNYDLLWENSIESMSEDFKFLGKTDGANKTTNLINARFNLDIITKTKQQIILESSKDILESLVKSLNDIMCDLAKLKSNMTSDEKANILKDAIVTMKQFQRIWIVGEPGTGKTYLLKQWVELLKDFSKWQEEVLVKTNILKKEDCLQFMIVHTHEMDGLKRLLNIIKTCAEIPQYRKKGIAYIPNSGQKITHHVSSFFKSITGKNEKKGDNVMTVLIADDVPPMDKEASGMIGQIIEIISQIAANESFSNNGTKDIAEFNAEIQRIRPDQGKTTLSISVNGEIIKKDININDPNPYNTIPIVSTNFSLSENYKATSGRFSLNGTFGAVTKENDLYSITGVKTIYNNCQFLDSYKKHINDLNNNMDVINRIKRIATNIQNQINLYVNGTSQAPFSTNDDVLNKLFTSLKGHKFNYAAILNICNAIIKNDGKNITQMFLSLIMANFSLDTIVERLKELNKQNISDPKNFINTFIGVFQNKASSLSRFHINTNEGKKNNSNMLESIKNDLLAFAKINIISNEFQEN